jgi:hypothetical protein
MRWHFRDHCIMATDLKIAALHIAEYSPRILVPQRDMNFI